eukprot:symbB.v1.2.031151.t1/scaffold3584.1/size53777/7
MRGMKWLLWVLVQRSGGTPNMEELAKDVLPDKNDDAWTTSSKFKLDLVEMFSNNSEEVVLEVGAHLGHCTRVLSRLFGHVLALEHSPPVLKQNALRNSDLKNVVYLKFHSILDDWSLFAESRIHVVFIDAAHDYYSVRSDLDRALALPHVHSIVLDDYGTRKGVHRAITEAVEQGKARLKRYVGRAPPWTYDGISEFHDWEGVVLEPVATSRRAEIQRLEDAVLGTSWVVFPAGVFSSGYFVPHGHLDLSEPHLGSSSYGAFEWRQAIQGELGGLEDQTLIFQFVDSPQRIQAQINSERTGMALLRQDGVVLVAASWGQAMREAGNGCNGCSGCHMQR